MLLQKNQVYKEAIDRYLLTLPADQRRNTELQMAGVKVVKESPKEASCDWPILTMLLVVIGANSDDCCTLIVIGR